MSPNDLSVYDTPRKRLKYIECTSLDDSKHKNIGQLAKDCNVTKNEDTTMESLSQNASPDMETSQTDLLQWHQGITTSSERLDRLFGPINGIPIRSVIEFSGASGCGKTQLCMTLALNVQLPIAKGGQDGQCIYIDTEGGLMVERFYQMTGKDNDFEQVQERLRNIMYYRVLDHMEMIALVRQLPGILQDSPKVKLLIVDSVAYHLRLNIRQNRIRVGLINFIGKTLAQLASQFNLAVVVTSHVSTDITFGKLRPALGDTWAQWCTKRLMLTRKRRRRFATIYDSSQRTQFTTEPFTITDNGIEDVDEDTLARLNQWQELETENVITSPHKTPHQGNGFSTWSAIYDSEDIWNEPGGFTDEFLSSIPLIFTSPKTGIDNDEGKCGKSPNSQQMDDGDDSTAITASDV